MKVAIHSVDGMNYPNLALMRISAYHKSIGDEVEWFMPMFKYDRVYASKVFMFTPDDPMLPDDAIRGGTGYDVHSRLPPEIEAMPPDYSIYPQFPQAYGFLTRGCVNKCPWCVVPAKEGSIHVVSDIVQVSQGRRDIVLMDNNFLASPKEFVREQLEIARANKYRIDFNQALDARRINEENAPLLAKTRWLKYVRIACDVDEMIGPCINAIRLLRRFGLPGDVMVYVLTKNGNDGVASALRRIKALTEADKRAIPFVMPYRSLTDNSILPNGDVKRLARWCNRAWVRKSCSFDDYGKAKIPDENGQMLLV